jgi:hypothetical protein
MKKISIIIAAVLALTISSATYAQAPPPPPPDHGSSGNQNGGNAPIGSGLLVLLGLGAAYGGKKFYDSRMEKLEE